MGRALARLGVTADQVTLMGAALGVAAGLGVATSHYGIGLGLIAANRLLDGLDGAVARATRKTDLGGYLDIVGDFIFYVSVPIGFGFADPANLPFALGLVGAFTLTGVSFLAFATLAARRRLETQAHGEKSFFYNTGLAEGTETIVTFVSMCLWPSAFPVIASVFAALCILTVVQRSLAARSIFGGT
jgi:phosphatidylglycerophosphate synthase